MSPDAYDPTLQALASDLDLALEARNSDTFLTLRQEAHGRAVWEACQHVAGLLSRAWRLWLPHPGHLS